MPRVESTTPSHTEGPQSERRVRNVWAINERHAGRTHWSKVGVAFNNRDGSISLLLDALPMSGKLQVRDRTEQEERPA